MSHSNPASILNDGLKNYKSVTQNRSTVESLVRENWYKVEDHEEKCEVGIEDTLPRRTLFNQSVEALPSWLIIALIEHPSPTIWG